MLLYVCTFYVLHVLCYTFYTVYAFYTLYVRLTKFISFSSDKYSSVLNFRWRGSTKEDLKRQFLGKVFHCTNIPSWNSLPCSHQYTFSIATFYRPPATTISYDSTSSSPEKEITSRNRLGTPPPPPPLDGGLRSQKGLRPFTHYRISPIYLGW